MPVLANTKHELFAQALAKGETADAAYQLAGYVANRHNASRLKTNETILERVAELQAAVADKLVIDEAYVLGTIHDTVERCRQAKPVLDRKGDPVLTELPNGEVTPAYAFDSKAVLRGAELLGKHIGMFKEQSKLDVTITTPDVSDTELARLTVFLLTKAAHEAPTVQ